jgi:hypothetical protein
MQGQRARPRLRRLAALAAGGVFAAVVGGAAGASRAGLSFAPTGAMLDRVGAVADFDGDGKPDLAVANASRIRVFLGTGAGQFKTAAGPSIAAGENPHAMGAADFDADGNNDLAVARASEVTGAGSITVYLGDGAGGFHPAPGPPAKAAGSPPQIVAADLNGDGKLDLGMLSKILLGDGSGRFDAGRATSLPGELVAVADIDGDGKIDALVRAKRTVLVLLADGAGGFRRAPRPPIEIGESLVSVASGDFDRDRRVDLAVALWGRSTRILLGDGAGGFHAAPGSPFKLPAWSVAVADFNGDRYADVAAGCECNVTVLLGNGKGRFRSTVAFPHAARTIVAAADLTGDARPDLALQGTILVQTPRGPTAIRSTVPKHPAKVFSTRRPITLLAADGPRAAVMTFQGERNCLRELRGQILTWAVRSGTTASFATDSCVDDVAVGDGRVAWINRSCGNSCDLWVSSGALEGGKARDVDHVNNGNGAAFDPDGGYVGQLLGGGPLLAYNSWEVCDPNNPESPGKSCPPKDPDTGLAKERLLRVAAGRRTVVKSGAGSYRLVAVGGGRMVVAAGGRLSVLAPNGSPKSAVSAGAIPPYGVALSKTRLAVEQPLSLDLYDAASGKRTKSLRLGQAAALELVGVNGKVAMLSETAHVVLVRLSDGKLISLPLQRGFVDARLTEAGLFYAYNTPRSAMKGHIVFEPTLRLLRRF